MKTKNVVDGVFENKFLFTLLKINKLKLFF